MQHLETRKSVVAFASLGAACTVMDEIGSGGQGKVAFGRTCPSVTQKRPLVSHFPTARWVALSHENESTGLPESSKRYWKTRAATGAAGVIRPSRIGRAFPLSRGRRSDGGRPYILPETINSQTQCDEPMWVYAGGRH